MKPYRIFAFAAFAAVGVSRATVVTRTLDYDVGGKKMQSVLIYDDAVKVPRPGIVAVPNWMGINDSAIDKARTIAGKDYVLLLADVYGIDARPKNGDEAGALTKSLYADRAVLRERVGAALGRLKAHSFSKMPLLDGRQWGAIGFCFGGAAALDLARSGADIAGVATFHANLSTDDPALAKNIKGRVLVMNGGDDKFVPEEQIIGFQKEMRDAGVDWQFLSFGGALHCFAESEEHGQTPGCVYNERAAKRAFAQMHAFFDEVFATK